MKAKWFGTIFVLAAFLVSLVPASTAGSVAEAPVSPIPVEISPQLRDRLAPARPSAAEAAEAVFSSTTTAPQCGGDGTTLTITIPSFDAANPGDQDVVF